MSKSKGKQPRHDGIENIEEVLSRTELYIEENKNVIFIVIAAVFIVVGSFLGYRKFVMEPKNSEAHSEMYMAERYFERDSFRLALEGDGQFYGFIDIIDGYGITKAAKLANYYAGICNLYLGEYDEAITYLKKFKSNDKLVQVVAAGAIGDAYSEMEEYDKAVQYYKDAANTNPNDLTSAIYFKKAGLTYEKLEDFQNAVEMYKNIQLKFPESDEARDIEKYIAAAELSI